MVPGGGRDHKFGGTRNRGPKGGSIWAERTGALQLGMVRNKPYDTVSTVPDSNDTDTGGGRKGSSVEVTMLILAGLARNSGVVACVSHLFCCPSPHPQESGLGRKGKKKGKKLNPIKGRSTRLERSR